MCDREVLAVGIRIGEVTARIEKGEPIRFDFPDVEIRPRTAVTAGGFTQFIEAQEGLDDELDALSTSKTAGSLSSFTGVQGAPAGLPVGSIDNGDGTFTLADGRVVRRKGG